MYVSRTLAATLRRALRTFPAVVVTRSVTKRLVKSPKTYFLDSGLAAFLTGPREAEQLWNGPVKGALAPSRSSARLRRTPPGAALLRATPARHPAARRPQRTRGTSCP